MPKLEEVLGAGQGPRLEDVLATAEPVDPDDPQAIGRAVWEGTKRFGQNLGQGGLESLSSIDHTAANLFGILDSGAHWLSEKSGASYGGAFARLESWMRRDSQALLAKARALSPGATPLDRVVQIVGALPGLISEQAAAVAAGGPIAGFAGLGALQRADEGLEAATVGAAGGALLGSVFKATEQGVGRLARGALTGGTAGGLAAAEGQPGQEVALGAAATGLFGALGARPPRRYNGIAPQAIPPEKPRLRRMGVLGKPGEPPPPKAPHPAVEVTDRHRAMAAEFLGRDYSEILPPDRAVNLNLRRLEGSNDLKAATADFVETIRPLVDDARRGTIGHQQTIRLAQDLGLTLDELLARRKGQALNAEEAVAYRTMNRSALENWRELARQIQRGGKAEDLDVLKAEFLRSTAASEAILLQTLGATAEAGRALDSFRIRVGPSTAQMKALREILQASRVGGEPVEVLAQRVAAIDTPEGLARFARDLTKPTFKDKFNELYINSLLSGLSVIRNLGTGFYLAWSLPKATAAATIGAITNPSVDRVRFREIPARAYGMIEAVPDALRVAQKTFLTEARPENAGLFDPDLPFGKPWGGAISGKLGRAIRTPSRALSATDVMLQTIAFRSELRAQAVRKAIAEGKDGAAGRARVAELVAKPTDAMIEQSAKASRAMIMSQELGELGNTLLRAARHNEFTTLLFPFVRFPINAFKTSLRQSPLGLAMRDVRAEIRAGGAVRDQVLGEMVAGSLLAAWVAEQAHLGNVTGSGPQEKRARAGWLLMNQPFSWKVGDKWVTYGFLEPFASLVGLTADAVEIWDHADEMTRSEIAGALGFSFRQNIRNKLFLQTFANAVQAADDPGRFGQAFVSRMAGSVAVPTGAAYVARQVDPVLRDARGVVDRIRSRIPGLSQDLPPVNDAWGNPVILHPGAGPPGLNFFSPFFQKPISEDPATREVVRLRAKLSVPDRTAKLRGLELSEREYSELTHETGRIAKQVIDRLVTSPLWTAPNFTDAMRKRVIEENYTEARMIAQALAFQRIADRDPVRVRQAILEKLEKRTGVELAP